MIGELNILGIPPFIIGVVFFLIALAVILALFGIVLMLVKDVYEDLPKWLKRSSGKNAAK